MPKVGSPEVVIVSAFTALSCNTSQGRAPNDNETAASSVVVVAPESPRPARGDRAVEDSPDVPDPSRLEALRSDPVWVRFKEVWRELDDVAPGPSTYTRQLDEKRSAALSEVATGTLRKLVEAKLVSEGEAAFLSRAVQLRIRNMTHGFEHLMMMHRMPFPYETEQAASVGGLERKLDVLVELRAGGKIGSTEFGLALEQVQREAITLYVITEVAKQGYSAPSVGHPPDGEAFLAEMSKRLEKATADAGVDAPIVQLVQESRVLVPAIRALVAELER